jgi:hypothetical protein
MCLLWFSRAWLFAHHFLFAEKPMEDFEFGLRKSLCLLFVGKEAGAGPQQEALNYLPIRALWMVQALRKASWASWLLRRTAFWLDSMPRLYLFRSAWDCWSRKRVCSTQAAVGPKIFMQFADSYEASRGRWAIGRGTEKKSGVCTRGSDRRLDGTWRGGERSNDEGE